MKLNKDKCIFITDELKFFGTEISSEGISLDKNNIKTIKHALPPSNISELRSFIVYVHMFQGLYTNTVKKQLYFVNYFKKIKRFLGRGSITKSLKN